MSNQDRLDGVSAELAPHVQEQPLTAEVVGETVKEAVNSLKNSSSLPFLILKTKPKRSCLRLRMSCSTLKDQLRFCLDLKEIGHNLSSILLC